MKRTNEPPGTARHPRRWAWLAAVAVVVVLGAATWLAGAASEGNCAQAAAAAAQQPGSPSPGPPPTPGVAPANGEGADGMESAPLTFGQRFTWPSGVAVEVAQPVPFAPSGSATGVTGNRVVLVRTTVRNGGKEPYHLNVFSLGPEATYGGVEATKVVDRARGTGNLTDVVVAPGGCFTYATALSIGAASGQLELDYTEALGDDDPAVFVGTV